MQFTPPGQELALTRPIFCTNPSESVYITASVIFRLEPSCVPLPDHPPHSTHLNSSLRAETVPLLSANQKVFPVSKQVVAPGPFFLPHSICSV